MVKKKKTKNKNNKKKKKVAKKKAKKISDNKKLIPSFFRKQKNILKIKKGQKTKLSITYMPMTFETHQCNIIFLD